MSSGGQPRDHFRWNYTRDSVQPVSARQVSANLMVERAITEYLERLLPLEQVVSATR